MPYSLLYYRTQRAPLDPPVDITRHIEKIPKFTSSGTGEIVSATVMLDSRDGEFVTRTSNGTTPILNQYELFELSVSSDLVGSPGSLHTYRKFLILDDISPQLNSTGAHLQLEFFGRELFLQKMNFLGHYYWISFRDMINEIVNYYNRNRGSDQPAFTLNNIDLDRIPKSTFGVFDFGTETSCYDALLEVVNRLNVPTAGGGDGQQWTLGFIDSTSEIINVSLQPKGLKATPSLPTPVLDDPMKLSRVKSPQAGNIVVVVGQKGSGTFPRQMAEMRGLIEEYENIPEWVNNTTYKQNAYARYKGSLYQVVSPLGSTAGALPTTNNWSKRTLKQYVTAWTGDSRFQYSPWTEHKSQVIKQAFGNVKINSGGSLASGAPPSSDPTGKKFLCVPDSNLVIRDANYWRDWVDFRVVNINNIPASYLYSAEAGTSPTVSQRLYWGMRLLLDSSLSSPAEPFATGSSWNSDKFGISYKDSMVMLDRDGDWIVFRKPKRYDMCCVLADGRTYEFNSPTSLAVGGARLRTKNRTSGGTDAWRDISDTHMGNDAFHYPSHLDNVDGLLGDNLGDFLDDSAIETRFRHLEDSVTRQAVELLSPIVNFFTDFWNRVAGEDTTSKIDTNTDTTLVNRLADVDTYNNGWWTVLFEAPYPKAGYGIGESVGQLFGGDISNKQPLLDLKNLNYTTSGKTGFGHADSDQLGEIDGIGFYFKFDVTSITAQAEWTNLVRGVEGNIPFRIAIYDILGNVWKKDVSVRFQNITEFIKVPFSAFENYRARLPVGFTLPNYIHRTVNPELYGNEILDQRLIKRIVFHCLWSYEDDGRYDPDRWDSFVHNLLPAFLGTPVVFSGIVDGFHFTKTAVAIARDSTDQGLQHLQAPIKKYPAISNQIQLQKIATAELDLVKHQPDRISYTLYDDVSLYYNEVVYVKDDKFIAESEQMMEDPNDADEMISEPNTREYIIDKITYSLNGKGSHAGIIATVNLSRRLAT